MAAWACRTLPELSRLEWLKIVCHKCGEEMTQYLTPQEEVDEALMKGGWLETVCSYCQNRIWLDARTFEPHTEQPHTIRSQL